MNIVPIRPKILSCQMIPKIDSSLGKNLELDLNKHAAIGIVTCDQDDSLYAALDHATKFAAVDVVYAKSFYAGANYSSGPFSGESIGIIAGTDSDIVEEGLFALTSALEKDISFFEFEGSKGPAFFPHIISNVGYYLSKVAGVPLGSSLAYLIAPPTESVIGLDYSLKAANVEIARYFGPPTETNFGGAYLAGALHEVEAAAQAFIKGIQSVVESPLSSLRKPERFRR